MRFKKTHSIKQRIIHQHLTPEDYSSFIKCFNEMILFAIILSLLSFPGLSQTQNTTASSTYVAYYGVGPSTIQAVASTLLTPNACYVASMIQTEFRVKHTACVAMALYATSYWYALGCNICKQYGSECLGC